jgi:hypothetical protein
MERGEKRREKRGSYTPILYVQTVHIEGREREYLG